MLLVGSVLSVLLRQQTRLESIYKTQCMQQLSIEMQWTAPNGFVVKHATVSIIWSVLQWVLVKQKPNLTGEVTLYAHLWVVDRPKSYRYIKRYKTLGLFSHLEMPAKVKKMKKICNLDVNKTPSGGGKYKYRSPDSSHKGEPVAEYTQAQMDNAKALCEANLAKPPAERKTQRQVAEESRISLGTLSKRITGKVPWTCNVGRRRIPKVLTQGVSVESV